MTEDKTAETNGPRSFEERVFARFDAMDARFDRVEDRIGKLEARQYDTKTIWEQALFAIAQTNKEMQAGFEKLRSEMDSRFEKLRSEMDARFEKFRIEMDAGFEKLRNDLDKLRKDVEAALHVMARKIDVLNQNILEVRAEQRFVESRLEKLES